MLMKPISFSPARYYILGEPGPAIEHIWVCLHGHAQSVATLAAQLVHLNTPERLLVLPEALSRQAHSETSAQVLDAPAWWFAPNSEADDLAYITTYLDGLTDHIRALCRPGTSVTVLGYGHGAAAAVGWLSANHLACDQLVLCNAVFPPEINRQTLFAALPPRRVMVVSTAAAAGFTPEADGWVLMRELLDAGQSVRLDVGLLTLAALDASSERSEGRL